MAYWRDWLWLEQIDPDLSSVQPFYFCSGEGMYAVFFRVHVFGVCLNKKVISQRINQVVQSTSFKCNCWFWPTGDLHKFRSLPGAILHVICAHYSLILFQFLWWSVLVAYFGRRACVVWKVEKVNDERKTGNMVLQLIQTLCGRMSTPKEWWEVSPLPIAPLTTLDCPDEDFSLVQ